MDFLRKNFYLLEAACFAAWGIVVGTLIGAIAGGSEGVRGVFAGASAGLLLGSAYCLFWWAFVIGMRWLWKISDWWFRVLMCLGAPGIPISLLVSDLHLKLLVSRFYTGGERIPYAFFGTSNVA